jgi:hypothetical protein
MKHLKTYESISTNQYLVIKHQKFVPENNHIALLETNNELSRYKILVQIIEPEKSSTYYAYLTEIYENTYKDEYNFTFEILYKSNDYKDTKKMFDIYSSTTKYNI